MVSSRLTVSTVYSTFYRLRSSSPLRNTVGARNWSNTVPASGLWLSGTTKSFLAGEWQYIPVFPSFDWLLLRFNTLTFSSRVTERIQSIEDVRHLRNQVGPCPRDIIHFIRDPVSYGRCMAIGAARLQVSSQRYLRSSRCLRTTPRRG